MSTPPITGWVPKVSADPSSAEIHRHLVLLFQKLTNHTTAFSLLTQKIDSLKAGSPTTVFAGGGGSGGSSSSAGIPVNNQSGVTSYATGTGDNGALIIVSDASPIAVSLTGETPPFAFFISNQGAATATLTPSVFGSITPTISYAGNPGASSMPILGGGSALVAFDGTNWWAELVVLGVSGSGTTGFLPLFTSPTVLGDSIIDYGVTTPGGLTSNNTGAGGTVFVDSGGGGIGATTDGALSYTVTGGSGSIYFINVGTGGINFIDIGGGGIQFAGIVYPGTLYSAAGTPLPAANSVPQGALAWVSDALLPTYNGVYNSGGAVTTIVISDGATNWFTH